MKHFPSFNNFRHWLSGAFLLLSLLFFIKYASIHLKDMPPLAWDFRQFSAMLASIVIYILSIGIVGFIWQLLVRDHGLNPRWWQLQIIFFITQFGKYLPGNAGHFVGRAYMARSLGVPASVTIHCMVIEAFFSVGIGAALAMFSFLLIIEPQAIDHILTVQPYTLALLTLITLLLPWASIRGLNTFLPRIAIKISGGSKIVEPHIRTCLAVAGLFLVCFLANGLMLKLHATFIFGAVDTPVLEFTALYAVAWVAGYLVPGAPAGLGIREALMVLLFSPLVGPAVAVGISLSLRVATTFGDALAFALGLLFRRLARAHFDNV